MTTPDPFSVHPFPDGTPPDGLPDDFAQRLLTPVLVVSLDRVRDNVQRMLTYTGGPERWRPHLKTTKIPAVWRLLLDAGVRHFKCATTREARVLCELADEAHVDVDLLVAYPLRGPGLTVLAGLCEAHPRTRLSVLVEDPRMLAEVPAKVGVFVDVNPGMHRTGVPLHDVETITALATGSGPRFRGLHCYDGHQHAADLDERRDRIFADYERLREVVDRLATAGARTAEIVTAGTPAFRHALAYEPFRASAFVHRVSPGTVVFHDGCTAIENPDVELQPAAFVLSRVVSHPTDGIATCDAGSKSLAAETGDPCAYALGRADLHALRPSEEHLPLRADAERPPRGEFVWLVPRHVCPSVNLAEQAVLIEKGHEPQVANVSARAHDVLAS